MQSTRSAWRRWRRDLRARRRYTTTRRDPFYDLAGTYLPTDPAAVVVDVGAGEGDFAARLNLPARFPNLALLDGNPASVARLQQRLGCGQSYRAPDRLPFADASVQFLHSSHLIEHLEPAALYALLAEIDRVLAPSGVLVVSAPLLSVNFYSDLSHVRPYNPQVLASYLSDPRRQRSRATISRAYAERERVYRLSSKMPFQELGSDLAPLDLLIQLGRFLLRQLRIRSYVRTGFTLVLEKAP
jgi:SAM-dependent methyltransferase